MSTRILPLVGNAVDRVSARDFDLQFAGNSGNALIQFGLEKLLPGANVIQDFDDCRSDGTKNIVIGLANFLSAVPMTEAQNTTVSNILEIIEKEKNIKIVLSSVGCDFSSIFSAGKIDRKRLEFIRKISSQSEFIGVRGFLTAEVMNDCGIENVWVVGCPAFSFPLSNEVSGMESIVRNGLVVGWKPDGRLRSFYGKFLEWASFHNATYIVQ